jgi:hypothetical protein
MKNLGIAAHMQDGYALEEYGVFLEKSDPQRWHWWGCAAKRDRPFMFLDSFAEQVRRFETDPSLGDVVFMIGRFLRGHVDVEEKRIFGKKLKFDARVGPANRAINFFTAQCAAARKAVDAWCLIALRINNKVNRDVRKKIGMLIWEARELAVYRIQKDWGIKERRDLESAY